MSISHACQILSTVAHATCRWGQCRCECHLPMGTGSMFSTRRDPRPHSYPRLDWKRRKPPGWSEAQKRAGRGT